MRLTVSAIALICACYVSALPQHDEYFGDLLEGQPQYDQQDQSGYDETSQPQYDQQDQSGYDESSQSQYEEPGSSQHDQSDQSQYERPEAETTNAEVRLITPTFSFNLAILVDDKP